MMHPYARYVNPHLGKMLTEIGLNKQFRRGLGCNLYDEQGNEYLDCIAAYGALPFGHNPPEIWQALHNLENNQEPNFVQPSFLEAAGDLASALLKLAPPGLAQVTFANSGAEAVEAAFKLCRAKTGKAVILSTDNSFHGKTLGALSATGNKNYQEVFFAPVPNFRYITYGDLNALENYLQKHAKETAAFILEPIQGEGGIVEPPRGYLKAVQDLCTKYGVLTIFDEIQTGLGRTGTMFACEKEQVTPDVLVLAKALGGGLIPIGAVLCKADVYTEDFALKHSSTFAGNTLGCRVGLAVLEKLTANESLLLQEINRKGALLKTGLEAIAQEYPQILAGIRGQGLMLGIEFNNSRLPYPNSLLGVLAEQETLTPLVSSYLLNVEGLRVAPTLNGASVIRIEPPLIINDDQVKRIVLGVRRVVRRLAERNAAAFLGHLVGFKMDFDPQREAQLITVRNVEPQAEDGRFAFLVHPVDLQNYFEFDASLALLNQEQLQDLSSRWSDLADPFVVSSTRITDKLGQSAYGEFICVPKTADALLALSSEQAVREISKAVSLAAQRGAQIVGLGAYTSVVTMGGRHLLASSEVALTTGNSYTVVSGVEAVLTAAEKVGLKLCHVTGAVVGAGGAIGKALSLLLSEQVQSLILVGNPQRPEKSILRMKKVVGEIIRHLKQLGEQGHVFPKHTLGAFVQELSDLPDQNDSLTSWVEYAEKALDQGLPITITVDGQQHLPKADVIMVATSSIDTLITPEVLKWGALVCDMSRPSNVSKQVLTERPDVLIIDGGVVAIPNKPDLGWDFGFELGEAFACMSETMMLALEKHYEHTSIGIDLNLAQLQLMRDLAEKQGFELAGFRNFDRPLDPKIWERVKKARQSLAHNA